MIAINNADQTPRSFISGNGTTGYLENLNSHNIKGNIKTNPITNGTIIFASFHASLTAPSSVLPPAIVIGTKMKPRDANNEENTNNINFKE